MKLASNGADAHERGVGERASFEVARDANSAADRVQAEQQHDERNELLQHRVGEDGVHESGAEHRCGRRHEMVGRPMAFDGRVVQKRVIGEREQREAAGDFETIQIGFPPVGRGGNERQDGNSG